MESTRRLDMSSIPSSRKNNAHLCTWISCHLEFCEEHLKIVATSLTLATSYFLLTVWQGKRSGSSLPAVQCWHPNRKTLLPDLRYVKAPFRKSASLHCIVDPPFWTVSYQYGTPSSQSILSGRLWYKRLVNETTKSTLFDHQVALYWTKMLKMCHYG